VYHSKHQSINAAFQSKKQQDIFLSEVNFISKFALLIFGGSLDLLNNALVVDKWLKFKVSSNSEKNKGCELENSVLILSLRTVMDALILEHVQESYLQKEEKIQMSNRHRRIIDVVRKLISDEA
jgi:hypothetical protein